MQGKNLRFPIIQTKLFRPSVVSDYITRPRLIKLLDQGAKCPLTLVSAPAGYGKSLLVSNWLESANRLHCWVSLDEEMNDLAFFLQHLLFSIRKLFSEACRNTLALTNSSEAQSHKILSTVFINELREIKAPVSIVLDDYGLIHAPDIHSLLVQLIQFLPNNVQLVLITRRDPPFPLHTLRAQAKLVEIRQTELQFTLLETTAFLKESINLGIDKRSLAYLYDKIEGWAAGLRLIALSLKDHGDVGGILQKMKGDSRHIQDYLMDEVLSRQSSTMRDGLLKTSILNSFCSSLYTAVCHPDCCDQCGPECDGQFFIKQLESSNIFCIRLDEQGTWFRYHHLFQQLLQRTLENHCNTDEITDLHQRAHSWYEKNGMIEEAFNHTLIINDIHAAGNLITRHRHELMNKEQWPRLRRLINLLPRSIVECDPELLMQDAWSLWNQMRTVEMSKVLDQVEDLLQSTAAENGNKDEIEGEIYVLRSIQYYLIPPCDCQRALFHAEKAVKKIPLHNPSTRGMAIIMLAMSYQVTGKLSDAFKVILEEINQREAQQNTYHTRLLITLCMIYWLETDLPYMLQTAKKLFKLSTELSLQESRDIGRHYIGLTYYCRNELEDAERYLKDPVQGGSKVNLFNFAQSAFVLSLTYLAQGRQTEAKQLADSVVQYAIDTGNRPLLSLANAFNAELALRQGKVTEALKWAQTYDPEPFTTAHRFYVPQLTYGKVLIAQHAPESPKKAADFLNRLYDFYQSIHHKYCLTEVLVLQALLYSSMDKESDADKKLTEALTLSEPGGHIRLFVDRGQEMAKLLDRQDKEGPLAQYIQSLKDEFVTSGSGEQKEKIPAVHSSDIEVTADPVLFSNPLTNREQEILELFARRMSNREIAEKLCIADNTVKRHATNIFRKLDVKNRRKAVEQANRLSIIS